MHFGDRAAGRVPVLLTEAGAGDQLVIVADADGVDPVPSRVEESQPQRIDNRRAARPRHRAAGFAGRLERDTIHLELPGLCREIQYGGHVVPGVVFDAKVGGFQSPPLCALAVHDIETRVRVPSDLRPRVGIVPAEGPLATTVGSIRLHDGVKGVIQAKRMVRFAQRTEAVIIGRIEEYVVVRHSDIGVLGHDGHLNAQDTGRDIGKMALDDARAGRFQCHVAFADRLILRQSGAVMIRLINQKPWRCPALVPDRGLLSHLVLLRSSIYCIRFCALATVGATICRYKPA